jgi:hypothetical protein
VCTIPFADSQIKEKEDPELERKTGEWIEDILGKSIADTSNLYLSLKDGVVLCEYAMQCNGTLEIVCFLFDLLFVLLSFLSHY